MKSLDQICLFNKNCFEKAVCGKDVDIKDSFLNNIDNNEGKVALFLQDLEDVRIALKNDLDFFYASDPAANSLDEIIMSYPGYLAISYNRIAHILYKLGYKIEARYIGEQAHKMTGIDIHPGATIGSPCFIDHGTGVVIGETAIIGERVKIYQGVTLGALSLSKGHDLKDVKRHPTIGNDVTIYSGVSILGDVKVGNNVTLGSNVFITEDIPSDTTVTIGKPILVYKKRK